MSITALRAKGGDSTSTFEDDRAIAEVTRLASEVYGPVDGPAKVRAIMGNFHSLNRERGLALVRLFDEATAEKQRRAASPAVRDENIEAVRRFANGGMSTPTSVDHAALEALLSLLLARYAGIHRPGALGIVRKLREGNDLSQRSAALVVRAWDRAVREMAPTAQRPAEDAARPSGASRSVYITANGPVPAPEPFRPAPIVEKVMADPDTTCEEDIELALALMADPLVREKLFDGLDIRRGLEDIASFLREVLNEEFASESVIKDVVAEYTKLRGLETPQQRAARERVERLERELAEAKAALSRA